MQNLKKNWLVVWKMTRIWWILTCAHEICKISTFVGSFNAKYITFDLKNAEELSFKDTEEGYKIWRITNCGTNLEDDMRNIANFYHSIWKYQNWDFDGIFLSKVENVWA